jgi:geranylgeranyl diphosphate synthase type II
MIRAACQMGAVLGGGSEAEIAAAGEFAQHLGLAFQIRDDMLDEIGTQEELGKPIGSDVENGKSTFVSLLGLEVCQSLVEKETSLAVEALQQGDFQDTGFLEELAKSLIGRKN